MSFHIVRHLYLSTFSGSGAAQVVSAAGRTAGRAVAVGACNSHHVPESPLKMSLSVS